MPTVRAENSPVFLPTRELLTIAAGFVSLYETTHLSFEETWRDTCILLESPLARGPREQKIKQLLEPLEGAMGGKVEVDKGGRFYLALDSGRMEMHLVAEGLRKLAMVARLIATGSLLNKGYMFWDEPESNLNPRIIRTVARTIMQIAQNGIQVFIGTHSLFLLRELHILQKTEFPDFDTRCFGLHLQEDGAVSVMQGKSMDDVGDIAALDEDLKQSDRYIYRNRDGPVQPSEQRKRLIGKWRHFESIHWIFISTLRLTRGNMMNQQLRPSCAADRQASSRRRCNSIGCEPSARVDDRSKRLSDHPGPAQQLHSE